MNYTNQDLLNYVSKIKLSNDKKQDYFNQIESIKNKVISSVKDMENTNIIKVRRAGSWKKGTALAPKGDYPLDIDMVFYMQVEEQTTFDAEELRNEIINALCAAYPNKERNDFTDGRKTIGIVFRGSGLEVDIVPFIPESGNTTYGRQPRKKLNSGEFKTSVDKQLKFIGDIKIIYSNFTAVVRILKSWRNYQELELSSFSIELIVAYLIKKNKIYSNAQINDAIIYFFEFLGNDDVVVVYFSGAIGRISSIKPWIADPTNNENNTLNLSNNEWNEVKETAENAFETLSYAKVCQENGKTLNLWREILGPSFNIQEL